LQLARPLELDREPTDLVELARRVVALHEGVSERHTLAFETTEPALVGRWDAARIERVLQNLLSNAIKYSPGGGHVWVRLWREPGTACDWAVLAVQDEGVGIPAADLPHIFERFHRASNVRDQIGGTGIGLATALAVVQQHGGQILVQSQEQHGSTFTLRLPECPP
jgi:signal transduction histidine kinase